MTRILGVAVKAAILAIVFKAISSGFVPLAGVPGQAQYQYMVSPSDPLQPLVLLVVYSASLLARTAGLIGDVLQKAAVILGILGGGMLALRAVDHLFMDRPSRSRRRM
jgi:hypothetical protein